MNTKYLHTLKTILETGSFQKAAAKLNYTQSTVTFHIQQLEQELSIKLFEKIGRRMILTQVGRDILPHIENILHETEFISDYGNNMSGLSGTLCVGMPDFLLCYKMSPLIAEFQRQAPNVRLTIPALSCKDICEGVNSGNLDMGIHCDIGNHNESVIEIPWSSYQPVLVASKKIPSTDTDFITPYQRKSVNLITSDSNSLHQLRLIKYLDKRQIVLDNNIDMGSLEAAKISVINNLGVAYFPDFTVEKEISDGTFVAINTELDNIPVPVVCAYHKNKWMKPAMELFKSLLFSIFPQQ